jgi:hypothetical protein
MSTTEIASVGGVFTPSGELNGAYADPFSMPIVDGEVLHLPRA